MPAVGPVSLDTPEALSQHPISHICLYSPEGAREGVGTRFLAGTDSSFASGSVPSPRFFHAAGRDSVDRKRDCENKVRES